MDLFDWPVDRDGVVSSITLTLKRYRAAATADP